MRRGSKGSTPETRFSCRQVVRAWKAHKQMGRPSLSSTPQLITLQGDDMFKVNGQHLKVSLENSLVESKVDMIDLMPSPKLI
jgi:hypothetical protein